MGLAGRQGARRLIVSASAVFFLCWSSLAESRPSIFVPNDAGYAWWARELVLRPMTTAVGRVGISDINAHLAARSAVTPQRICFVEAVLPGDILSADRATQQEIDATLRQFPNSFTATYTARSGRSFNVQVVTYEVCGASGGATALLITNADGSLHSFHDQEFLFTRISKRPDGKINVFGCFECGDVSELLYDAENDRFYTQWIGH